MDLPFGTCAHHQGQDDQEAEAGHCQADGKLRKGREGKNLN